MHPIHCNLHPRVLRLFVSGWSPGDTRRPTADKKPEDSDIEMGSLQDRVTRPNRELVNQKNRWWYKIVTRKEKSMMKLVRLVRPFCTNTYFIIDMVTIWSRDPVLRGATATFDQPVSPANW